MIKLRDINNRNIVKLSYKTSNIIVCLEKNTQSNCSFTFNNSKTISNIYSIQILVIFLLSSELKETVVTIESATIIVTVLA